MEMQKYGDAKKFFLAGFVLVFLVIGLAIRFIYSDDAENGNMGTAAIMKDELPLVASTEEETRKKLIESTTATDENVLSYEERKKLELATTALENSENLITREEQQMLIESVTVSESVLDNKE